ncbi:hypothetical protein EGX35_14680 [Clavibacter nebraskensis]|uniref:Uncharacterized protein n=1 Tax=Clavibacter nebraskensis TaxID=31963 RepID=A0ABY4MTM1_9MICO|nr:hypothetical protein [Clavibacter nebraskensis]QKO03349.1 hypothetical protein EGX35_14680 [Clavibacter nebraskensis]QLL36622.1 hypothetical protein EGX37_14680 [Clavibacter nebraskensis]UQB05312.1 hypothetical protein LIV34_000329 [Clavibacter nebraskensis]UQB08135.1 hypothetical protein LIX21_000329 [Clavibacter nebraskensis]UQB10968.1 hypothetical protein LIX19_000331 [Clavibacter nebraskensis]
MDRTSIPLWAAVAVPLLVGAVCFSLLRSEWAIVVFAVVLLGIAVVHRVAPRRPRG